MLFVHANGISLTPFIPPSVNPRGCFQAQIDSIEGQISRHTEYQQSCETLSSWLQDSKHKLLGCSDVIGDAQTIADKLAHIQVNFWFM